MSLQSTTTAWKVQTHKCLSLTPAAMFYQCERIEFQLWAFWNEVGSQTLHSGRKQVYHSTGNKKMKDRKTLRWFSTGCYMHNWVAELKKKEAVQFCANPWHAAALHGATMHSAGAVDSSETWYVVFRWRRQVDRHLKTTYLSLSKPSATV